MGLKTWDKEEILQGESNEMTVEDKPRAQTFEGGKECLQRDQEGSQRRRKPGESVTSKNKWSRFPLEEKGVRKREISHIFLNTCFLPATLTLAI